MSVLPTIGLAREIFMKRSFIMMFSIVFFYKKCDDFQSFRHTTFRKQGCPLSR